MEEIIYKNNLQLHYRKNGQAAAAEDLAQCIKKLYWECPTESGKKKIISSTRTVLDAISIEPPQKGKVGTALVSIQDKDNAKFIVGKGAATLNEIIASSGVEYLNLIDVKHGYPGTIKGNAEAVEKARAMMEDKGRTNVSIDWVPGLNCAGVKRRSRENKAGGADANTNGQGGCVDPGLNHEDRGALPLLGRGGQQDENLQNRSARHTDNDAASMPIDLTSSDDDEDPTDENAEFARFMAEAFALRKQTRKRKFKTDQSEPDDK